MPEDDVVLEDDETSGASKKTRYFARRHLIVGILLLRFVARNLTGLQVDSVHGQLSSLLYAIDYSKAKGDGLFEILCTTERRRTTGGSYIIRCLDFKDIAERCTENVRIYLYTHDQLIFKPNSTNPPDGWMKDFNATVTVKLGLKPKPRFGRLFMDVVDRYSIFDDLDPKVEVIVQTKYHALDKFPNHTYHVVEHWYNSFPEDMRKSRDFPEFDLPVIEPVSKLTMATVWTNVKQPCPTIMNNSEVIYDCIAEKFAISRWYRKYFDGTTGHGKSLPNAGFQNHTLEIQRLESLLQDPMQGPGRIYYELFWRYDVLVVPAKTSSPEKLRWGNVQRAVSQMRSGVPVLLEIHGEVLEDFMTMYNYTCAYKNNGNNDIQRKNTKKAANKITPNTIEKRYWSLEEAVMAMKESHELRRNCQEEGLAIAKDYSPARLVERELRILGFEGDFDCPR